MNFVSVITPCYNEEDNISELCAMVKYEMTSIELDYEHIIIDNASTDSTVKIVKEIASTDNRVKLIVNTRNFGHIRSPIYALYQAKGDAVMIMAADLEDPPSLIPSFVAKWKLGFKIVVGVKFKDNDTLFLSLIRRVYYLFLKKIGDAPLIQNYMGYGLYDKVVIEHIKKINDPYPYFRGLISDIGYEYAVIPYEKPKRKRGVTKNNFYDLYDMAMLGITNYSKVPLRIATIAGFSLSLIFLLISFVYLVLKLLDFNNFSLGIAPMVIGLYFIGSVQLLFIGVLGEYIGAILTQTLNRPLVIVKERVNFND